MAILNQVEDKVGSLQQTVEPIAVVSVACRLPGHVTNPQKLWELLHAGGVAVSNVVPLSRYDGSAHFDGSGKPGTMKAMSGMYIEDIDPAEFDAPFFNISKSDAVAMDPQQRQLLEVVYECLENGGISLEKISGENIACYVGSYSADYHDIQNRNPIQRTPGMTVGIGRAILSNRISHFLNIKGASWTIDSACSGGLVGVDVACQYLRARKSSAAIVAGVNLWMSPEHLQETGTLRAAYSASGRCHTFDSKADGYCRAEAVNAVFLKRLSDAIADGDPIRAVIRGSANNSDGWTPGINSPSSEAQAAVIRAAYADAGLDSRHYFETGYLECHGTGTPAGDPLEVKGAASVLSHMRPPSEPLIIGSLKSNVGHSEPGAGISGLIKATIAVEGGVIPGNPTFIKPNPNIDFEGLRVRATRFNIPWPNNSNNYRRASVNSFGYGGSNAHVVLENTEHYLRHHEIALQRAPSPYVSSYLKAADLLFASNNTKGNSGSSKRKPQVLVFSANDETSLNDQITAISAHILNPRVSINLSDLSYTLSERRSRHFFRASMVSYPTHDGKVTNLAVGSAKYAKKPQSDAKICFVFTGQGAQWSEMGADLIKMFPKSAKVMVEKLDRVLQELPAEMRPEWSLLEELVTPRTPEHLRKPEYSQPLVTALQLAFLAVLESWGVRADAVVGHSSGEIACAYSAGLLTPAQAILAAYFRGVAAEEETKTMGMMAVGLGADSASAYLLSDAILKDEVAIACYNSPSSVTLSGPVKFLKDLAERIQADGHFARLLKVDLAYHSHHMSEIANKYENLLVKYGQFDGYNGTKVTTNTASYKPVMVSSVTEKPLNRNELYGATYWKSNMVSPVRFSNACKQALADDSSNHVCAIEIGPSNALSGPIGQIIKDMGVEDISYISTARRGQDGALSLVNVAEQLFLKSGKVSLRKVNSDEADPQILQPAVIIDLPNYKWNHSKKYWHESLASKDWRFKKFPEHDLLGSKVLGTLWQSPTWQKELRIADVPWLKDHKIGTEILFPAAGYVAMAIEAVRQTVLSTVAEGDMDFLTTREHHYCLRDVKFTRALVLNEDADTSTMLTLSPMAKLGPNWWEFSIMSLLNSNEESPPLSASWSEHSKGLIRLEFDAAAQGALLSAPPGVCDIPLEDASPASLWYKAMTDTGYSYGPDFQTQTYVESRQGSPISRSLVSLKPPKSKWEPQSCYFPIHPAPMDGCLQSIFTSLHRGNRSSFEKVLLPASVDSIIASGLTYRSGDAVAVTESRFMLVGNPEESRKAVSDASVYDPSTKSLILELKGIGFSTMDVGESIYTSHTYACLAWKPDFNHLNTDDKLSRALSNVIKSGDDDVIRELLSLAAHKSPHLSVLELNLTPDTVNSLWLEGLGMHTEPRAEILDFHYASAIPEVILGARELYSQSSSQYANFILLDPLNQAFSAPTNVSQLNLILVRIYHSMSASDFHQLSRSLNLLLVDGGSVIFHSCDGEKQVGQKEKDLEDTSTLRDEVAARSFSPADKTDVINILRQNNFRSIRQTPTGIIVAEAVPGGCSETQSDANTRAVFLVRLCSTADDITSEFITRLKNKKWTFTEIQLDGGLLAEQLPAKSTVLILDEISQPVLATATKDQWESIQVIIRKECNILWVTKGSQMEVRNPHHAVCHGVFRTVRAEEPLLRLITLDVESLTMECLSDSVDSIDDCLEELNKQSFKGVGPMECEFAERGGLLHVSRVLPDEGINRVKIEDGPSGVPPVMVDFHTSDSTIRMAAERLGSLDALQFYEVNPNEAARLQRDDVEIEIFASSCNYKDVVVAMGIVPEDQKRLGWDGAGIITRVGTSVTDRHRGQRVGVYRSGCFGNRVTAPRKVTFPIPDSMSFEEAATLPITFATGIYGLYHLANLKRGQRVLIHSAAGGVGIACIQLCQRLDCEIFATVGSSEKRQFLTAEFGIQEDHIFSSRSPAFARGVRQVTQGYGVDVVVNSLTGNLLDDSWRLLAPHGTLIQIAKKDSFDRNCLSMEPFAFNCSFRSLDISILPLDTFQDVFSELVELIERAEIKPISPRRVWGYQEIPEALKALRPGTHIGKFVISNGRDARVMVPVRPLKYKLSSVLNPDHTYLIVGGLKGICGSLAIHLAHQGARNLTIMSRSGYKDKTSQSIIQDVEALGCSLCLFQGDVSVLSDVRRCFEEALNPIGGIIQGAAVFRDRTFESMSHGDYHAALSCKVQGTWNLHTVSMEKKEPIVFFTMLSSTSGLVGQKGQANYAGGNVFEDALAAHRLKLNLPGLSINLGPVEDVGVIQGNEDLEKRFDRSKWFGINEALLRRIVDYSILQQHPDPQHRLNVASQSQMITGIVIPQPQDSELVQRDARFSALVSHGDGASRSSAAIGDSSGDKDLEAFFLLAKSSDPNRAAVVTAAVAAIGAQFSRQLRLSERMDPARPLSVYGMDSLAAVEFRNWVRMNFGAELTTLDVMNATSLVALCEKVVTKMGIAKPSN